MTDSVFVEAALTATRNANRKAEDRRRDFRATFQTPAGDRVITDIMQQAKVFSGAAGQDQKTGSWKPRTPNEIMMIEGARMLALWIVQQCYPEESMARRGKDVRSTDSE